MSSADKSEMERKELFKAIWKIAEKLRGTVNGWDFKEYVLGMIFYRYLSENITDYINKRLSDANQSDDYTQYSDEYAERGREEIRRDKGFYILPSQLFCNVVQNANNNQNLNKTLENTFLKIEQSAIGSPGEQNFKGLFKFDFNSDMLGDNLTTRNRRLVKILRKINEMNLGSYKDNTIDVFGDAYEFLMGMYASKAGKSGGEFFTPQEVSELLVRITLVDNPSVKKIYDPACGSGSLLLKYLKIIDINNVNGFYGQESNITTYNLCRMNMLLHDVPYDKCKIFHGDTLKEPKHNLKDTFDAIVSNPPFSLEWEGDNNTALINDPRYSPATVLAPSRYADYAFIMHSLYCLDTNGTAAIICSPGVLSRNNRAEKTIRQYLIENNFIECIIQLPKGLFFGTNFDACIMVLKKSKKNNDIIFIDASNECENITNNIKLTPNNIENILKAYVKPCKDEHFARVIPYDNIKENEYNLSVYKYVKVKETLIDTNIQNLNSEIKRIVSLETKLRGEIDKNIGKIAESIASLSEKRTKHKGDSSNILKLITTLCPNGVEKKCIKDICEIRRGKVISRDFIKENPGDYPVYSSQTENNGILGKIKTYEYDGEYVTWTTDGARAGTVFYRNGKFNITNVCGLLKVNDEIALTKYIYYVLEIKAHLHVNRNANPKLMSNMIAEIDIPIPTIEIQKEIVSILDTFLELSTQFSIEQELRKDQYIYYRNILFKFLESSVSKNTK